MKITKIETDLLRVPLRRPVALPASQDPRSAKEVDVVLVHIHSDNGQHGTGMTFALGGGGSILRSVIDTQLSAMLLGENPGKNEWLAMRARAELESLGFTGIAARAYAGVDFALWDLKGKMAGLSVCQLLGGYRSKLKGIVSDVATPALGAKQAAKETKHALDAGGAGLIVEVGTQDPDLDVERVRQLKEALPEGVWFEVSACGRYDFSTGLWMGRVFEEDFGIDGYADPLRPDDLEGLQRLTDRLEVAISVGALYDRVDDFLRVLQRGGISALRIDPVRVGGLTIARKIAIAAELRQVAVVPVLLPEIGTHLAGSLQYGRVCEYVDWLTPLYDDGPRFVSEQLVVPDGPGLGLNFKEERVAKYRL